MPRLEIGQRFADLQMPLVGGGTVSLPGGVAGDSAVVFVYRGAWCPYYPGRLAASSRGRRSPWTRRACTSWRCRSTTRRPPPS